MKDIKELNNLFDEFVIIEEYPEIDYTIMKRKTNFQPWMAVWGLNKEDGCWSNGHYFEKLEEAVDWVQYQLKGIHREKVEEIATQLIDYVKENDDLDEVLDDYGIELDYSEREFFCLDEDEEN